MKVIGINSTGVGEGSATAVVGEGSMTVGSTVGSLTGCVAAGATAAGEQAARTSTILTNNQIILRIVALPR
jgi:hypothetical protein